jgi:hypothetical protein
MELRNPDTGVLDVTVASDPTSGLHHLAGALGDDLL